MDSELWDCLSSSPTRLDESISSFDMFSFEANSLVAPLDSCVPTSSSFLASQKTSSLQVPTGDVIFSSPESGSSMSSIVDELNAQVDALSSCNLDIFNIFSEGFESERCLRDISSSNSSDRDPIEFFESPQNKAVNHSSEEAACDDIFPEQFPTLLSSHEEEDFDGKNCVEEKVVRANHSRTIKSSPFSNSSRKTFEFFHQLPEQEKLSLAAEGFELPTSPPETFEEEQRLKKLKRKIKNKQSAQESRRKKRELVDGLNDEVTNLSRENKRLKEEVATLKKVNKTMLCEMKKLAKRVFHNPETSRGAFLMMILSMGMLIPNQSLNQLYGPSTEISSLSSPFEEGFISAPRHSEHTFDGNRAKLVSSLNEDDEENLKLDPYQTIHHSESKSPSLDPKFSPPLQKNQLNFVENFISEQMIAKSSSSSFQILT